MSSTDCLASSCKNVRHRNKRSLRIWFRELDVDNSLTCIGAAIPQRKDGMLASRSDNATDRPARERRRFDRRLQDLHRRQFPARGPRPS